jgi:hypothetical protein
MYSEHKTSAEVEVVDDIFGDKERKRKVPELTPGQIALHGGLTLAFKNAPRGEPLELARSRETLRDVLGDD